MLAWALLLIARKRVSLWLPRLPLAGRYAIVTACIVLPVTVPLLPFRSLALRPFVLTNSVLIALVVIRSLPDRPARWRHWDWVLLGVAVLMLFPMLIAVLSDRSFRPDEASYADLASSYFTRGAMYFSSQLQPAYKIEPGRGWSAALYGWLLEHVSFNIMTGRAINFGSNLLAFIGIGAVSWRLYGTKAAAISTMLAIIDLNYISILDYRPDHQMPAGAMAVTFAAFQARYSQRRAVQTAWHALCGLLAVLSLELHGVGIILAISFSLYYLAEFGLVSYRQRRWADGRPLAGFALGAALGLVIYYLLNIAPVGGVHTYLDALTSTRGQRRNTAVILYSPQGLFHRAVGWTALAYLAWRRSPTDRRFLGLFAIIAVVGTVVDTQGYITSYIAFFSVALGVWIVGGFQSETLACGGNRQTMLAALVMAAAITGLLWSRLSINHVENWLETRQFPPYMYAEIGSRLDEYLEDGDVVVSTQMLIWSLHDDPVELLSPEAEPVGMRRWHITGVEVWERVQPDVVVDIPQNMTLPPGLLDYMQAHEFDVCADFRFYGYEVQILRADCPTQ
jgi:hypothetical protein